MSGPWLNYHYCCFYYYFVFLRPHLRHMEVPRLGVQAELKSLATAIATATANGIWAASVTYATVHSNTRSLTHWARPGIEPVTSWILVRFVSPEPSWELLNLLDPWYSNCGPAAASPGSWIEVQNLRLQPRNSEPESVHPPENGLHIWFLQH